MTSANLRALAYDLATQLAANDARCAQMVLGALLRHHHEASLTAAAAEARSSTDLDLHSINGQTLAGLPSAHARALATRCKEALLPYYEFGATLLYSTLNAHLQEPHIVSVALRLALLLATEAMVLPPACERFARLLKQAAALRAQEHPIGIQLVIELQGTEHAFVSNLFRREPLALLTVTTLPETIAEMLRAAPPSDEWRSAAMERQQLALSQATADGAEENLLKALGLSVSLLQAAVAPGASPPTAVGGAAPSPASAEQQEQAAEAEPPPHDPSGAACD